MATDIVIKWGDVNLLTYTGSLYRNPRDAIK